jgi:hypothetical protein
VSNTDAQHIIEHGVERQQKQSREGSEGEEADKSRHKITYKKEEEEIPVGTRVPDLDPDWFPLSYIC